jgi:NhaP-type Na+/H+ or K+/H+ antiporter
MGIALLAVGTFVITIFSCAVGYLIDRAQGTTDSRMSMFVIFVGSFGGGSAWIMLLIQLGILKGGL